jgi:hypothetical protein
MISKNGQEFEYFRDGQVIFKASLAEAPDPTKTEVGIFLILTTSTLPLYVCNGSAWVLVEVA